MSCSGNQNCDCGCCSGTAVQTPQGETNLPGLSSIRRRTGTWSTFKESMLARLSSSDYPALGALKTRDDDDLSIAFLDATAVVLDILTFYQERLANESYLRTATQLSSLTQLSQLIGYQPSPGVAASTYLAFTLRAAPGLPPNPNTTATIIPAGTQVQSVPGQGQKPQAFQTSADILAKADWNALQVQTGVPWAPASSNNLYPFAGQTSLYLAGTGTQLNPGDAILIVGDERLNDPSSDIWDVCHVVSVQPDTVNQRTLITWAEPLGSAHGNNPSQKNPRVYALRQRASLFGYNAMNPNLLYGTTAYPKIKDQLTGDGGDWQFGTAFNSSPSNLAYANLIDLDSVYSKLTNGGWLVIDGMIGIFGTEEYTTLYNLSRVSTVSRSDYGLSAKITRIAVDKTTSSDQIVLDLYYIEATRSAAVLAQSELLPVCEQPLDHPLYGTLIDLESLRPDLVGITAVAVTGANPKLTVNTPDISNPRPVVYFAPNDDPTHPIALVQGQVLTLLQPPNSVMDSSSSATPGAIPSWASSSATPVLAVADSTGRTGTINVNPANNTPLSYFTLTAASPSDPAVQEVALVASVGLSTDAGFAHTQIQLTAPLVNVYDRAATTINANVGAATAGSPVTELLGSGSAATPNQQFTLKQSPLTYTPSPTPSGSASTLTVRANGAAWQEVSTLYGQPPSAQVYTTLNLPGGTATVTFGDGVEGARLPTGSNNIQASYRVGIGAAGNVPANAITTLVDRPIGVSGVFNPEAATGGQDAQSIDDIRSNAPLSVLTLGRAVSLTDYQNFASNFAGISKAFAIWIPNGPYRSVFLTIASSNGAELPATSQTFSYLAAALKNYGNPNVAINIASYYETTFGLSANILYDPAYSQPAVEAAVMALLRSTYSFASRTFGQGVFKDEIAALIQSVPGVVAVNVLSLDVIGSSNSGDIGSAAYSIVDYNRWLASAITLPRPSTSAGNGICAYIPVGTVTGLPYAAEILVLDPDPSNVKLGTMTS